MRVRTAEYWTGWQAFTTRQPCAFTAKRDRREWSRGFAAAVAADQDSKAWYNSRTVWAGVVTLVVGGGLMLYGLHGGTGGGGGMMYAAAGGGMSVSSVLFTGLRLFTDKAVTLGGGGQYYSPTPIPGQ